VEEDVRVGLDQTRKERLVRERQALGAGRDGDGARRPRGLDPLPPDHHPPSGSKGLAVEDPRRLDRIELRQQKT
jgi:hypothetical protein